MLLNKKIHDGYYIFTGVDYLKFDGELLHNGVYYVTVYQNRFTKKLKAYILVHGEYELIMPYDTIAAFRRNWQDPCYHDYS